MMNLLLVWVLFVALNIVVMSIIAIAFWTYVDIKVFIKALIFSIILGPIFTVMVGIKVFKEYRK